MKAIADQLHFHVTTDFHADRHTARGDPCMARRGTDSDATLQAVWRGAYLHDCRIALAFPCHLGKTLIFERYAMSFNNFRPAIFIATILAGVSSSFAAQPAAQKDANDKLMIVNGNSGHVIYDDGHDDMYCVTRRHVIGYDRYGNAVRSRSMRCR